MERECRSLSLGEASHLRQHLKLGVKITTEIETLLMVRASPIASGAGHTSCIHSSTRPAAGLQWPILQLNCQLSSMSRPYWHDACCPGLQLLHMAGCVFRTRPPAGHSTWSIWTMPRVATACPALPSSFWRWTACLRALPFLHCQCGIPLANNHAPVNCQMPNSRHTHKCGYPAELVYMPWQSVWWLAAAPHTALQCSSTQLYFACMVRHSCFGMDGMCIMFLEVT